MTDYLNPWYAIETDASKQTYYNRPASGVRLYIPPPKLEPKPFVKPQKKSHPTIVYRSTELVLMELAVKARKEVKNGPTIITATSVPRGLRSRKPKAFPTLFSFAEMKRQMR